MKYACVALLMALTVAATAQTRWQFGGNPYSPDSADNPYSTINNPYSPESPRNPYGQYGNEFSPNSARNPYGRGLEVSPTANDYDSWTKRFNR